mgnify:CR=1 FL=1
MDRYIDLLVAYGLEKHLIEPADAVWCRNTLLDILQKPDYTPGPPLPAIPLPEILSTLTDDAVARGLCGGDIVSRDLFDTRLMGALPPRPSQVRRHFFDLYRRSPQAATDWYYTFSGDTNYIRRDRIARDLRWQTATPYGTMDLSINLSKPEKDPKAVAALRHAVNTKYPRCALCAENEGYAGRIDHPARQNHRVIPLTVAGEPWYLQYSPYVYFPEHCILFSHDHRPMEISEQTFRRLLDFVTQFPHYFMGSNADLPIVGGSIQTHDHFQGGRYPFPMERAEVEETFAVPGFPDVSAGILRWPVSVIRLRCADRERLAQLAGHILARWRAYTDGDAHIFASTDGEPHNTITPIARRRGEDYELDLGLPNNLTTEEYPLGLYHPHPEIHHIKRETIGLIEVMGLAILPPRLKAELSAVANCLVQGGDLCASPLTIPHAPWGEGLRRRYAFTEENVLEILQKEVGLAFAQGLEHAGVFKTGRAGRAAFRRFTASL